MADSRAALVLSYSNIESDPRVRRQIDWLTGDGWAVDTLGLGASPEVREHFTIAPPRAWMLTKWGAAAVHLLIPHRLTFRITLLSRVPKALRKRIRAGEYQLVVFNETEFGPWLSTSRDFAGAAASGRARLHLDLHEYHHPERRRNTFGGRLTSGYYRWVRSFMGHSAFTSRSAVNDPIGRLHAGEFGFAPPVEMRNIPPYAELAPTPVDPGEIKLLFHGMASMQRGFREILEAMRILPEHFSMTFMLMPNPKVHDWLREQFATHPAKDRLSIVPPAPMREITERINEYDLEIIYYRPHTKNLEFAQPNKFFEAIQARMGVVVAEGKTMAPIIRQWQNGVVVSGYEGSDLAAALAPLSADDVTAMKEASDQASRELNAEVEGARFTAIFAE